MNILEAQELRRGKKSVRPFSLPPVGAAPLTAPAGPAPAPAAASAPVIPSAPKQRGVVGEVLHDVGQTARAVGTGLYSAFADRLPRQVAATALGSDVALGDGGAAQRYVAKQDEDLKRWEMSPEDRENKLFGIVKAGTVQQGLQQMGNSIAPMIAGIVAGAAAGSAGAGPIGTIAGAAVGAGALTAPMAYRASKADYILQMRDAFKQARPNGTEEEWQKFKASIEDNAKLYGLWEAGPEIVGNMVSMALIKTPAGGILKAIPLIESNAARLLASGVAKLALDMPVEVLTESVTGYNQAKIEYASGLRAEPPTPAGAFVEAAPQTIIMTLATMGLGSVANSLMTDNSGQVQRHKIIRLLNKSGVGRETINDLLDAKDWNGFNASMKKHEAEISKVGAELAEATAGTPAAAVDPNAPKVNPILNPEAAPSVFDVPVGAQPSQDATAVNPLLAQNQPTTNAEDEATVRRAFYARGPAYAGIRAVEPPPSAGVAAVKEVSDKIGIKVIWIDGAPVGGVAIQGAAPAGENTIFLHTDLLTNPKRDPVMMVYAHELTHRIERASPKEYGILRDSVLARAEARAIVEEKVASGMSRAAAESEAVAEQVEVLGTDQAFWSEVFAGKEQSFIEHIIQIVTDIAQRVFGTNQAAKAEAIRGAAVSAFQALQAQSQVQNQSQNQTINQQEAANGVQEGKAQEVAKNPAPTELLTIPEWASEEIKSKLNESLSGETSKVIGSSVDFPEYRTISKEQRDDLLARGFTFDVDRMGNPRIRASQKAREALLRETVKAKVASRTPEIKAPPEAKASPATKPSRSEVAKLRRESEAAKVERARLRESKRKAEIEWNKKFKSSGITRGQAAKARRIYDYDRGDAPVLSVVIDQFGGISPESAKAFEIDKASIPRSIREKLFAKSGKGSNWNEITWAIEHENLIPGVLRADEVGAALSKEIKAIQSRAKEEKAQARAYRQRDEDDRGFKRWIIRDDKNAKVRREAVDLREGDVLVRKIDGIPVEFKVSEVEDTTGNIVLKSTLYGRQPVEYFEMVHADKLIPAEEAVGGAEDVPFSTKEIGEEGETLASTASSIEDEAERDAFARAELEKRSGVPIVKGPKNLSELSQNHVVATSKDLLERLASGEIDAVEAMESLEAVEKRVGRTVARAESKAAKEAKMAGESRQQGLPGMEGLAKSPYGTPDDGANGTLFSAKKLTQDDLEDNGEGRTREYSISRFFRETLKREWSASYKQKSAQQAIGELQAITEKQGENWVMDHLFDLSKETQAEFPMALRPLAARHIIESADKAFRAWGVNDDGSNLPGNPAIDKLWLKIEDIRNKAAAYEREGGRGMAWLRSTYEANNVNSPVGVRKTVNKLHDKLAAPVIGPVKAPIIDKASRELKAAYDEAITALEEERKRNSELEESLRVLDEALGKRISQNEARIKQRAAKSEAYRRGIDEDLAATMEELKAVGMSLEGLSSKPTIEMIQKAVKLYIGIHGADEAKVADFLNRNLGEKLAPATVKALINDAQLALDNAGRAAEKATPRKSTAKQPSAPRKGATVINRAPDMTIQGPTSGPQRLFDSGKMWGEGRVLNIGEGDAKRLALELTEAGQTVMRNISTNLEVIISNAVRHGRNKAGIAAKLIEAGVDTATANRIARDVVKARQDAMRPAIETLRQRYAKRGDKIGKTVVSAMDRIMRAMELADAAAEPKVSGFFDGNAWDESRHIIEEAFGFKSEITRDWFNETMRLYREYEKADEAGNHLLSSVIHSEMLHRIARVQNGTGASLAVRSYIEGGMLWGPQTHWWNLFDTASRNIDAANAAMIEQIIKAARAEKGKKLEYLKAAFAPWAIMGMSHKQAWGVAKYIMKTGVNPLSMRIGDEAKFGTDPKVASAPEWHPFYKKLAMRPFKHVGRALIAADAYFRTNIENTDIYLQAYNAAISRGESAPIAAKQALGMIGFVTDGTNEAYNEAARKADKNGLKGVDRDMNIRIELMNKLDPEMRDHAQKQGAAETFNDPNPEGLAGWMADHLRHHSSDPIIFYLGMFARIGANVFNYGLQTNPITGFLSLAKDSKFGRYKAGKTNVKLTSEERVRRTIRATQGLAITGTVLAMALSEAKDYDEDDDPNKKLKFGVSAIGPRDPAARKLWRQQHKPFMLTINGKEISYKWIAPLATPLVLAGAIMDEIRFGSLKDAETDEAREESFLSALLPTMIMGLMSITTDELPGQGMVKFADMIYSGGEGGAQSAKAWNRFFQQQAASLGTAAIPYSALVRYLDRVYDPTVYTPNSIDGLKMYPYAFLRNMPVLRKAALYPMRNIFGDPIQTPDRGSELGVGERAARLMFDRFLNNMVEDQDIQFLTKVQRGFNAPSRKETRIVTNENGLYGLRNLTDAEYDRFLDIFGKELRTQIVTIRKDYSSSAEIEKWATPQNKALRKRLEDARSTAMNWAMYKFLTETGKQVVRRKE